MWRSLWLSLFQIGGVEAFGEPAIDRREQVVRFAAATLVAPEPGEAHRGAQFPELGLLLSGNGQSPMIQFLGGLGTALPQEQLAFVAVQLRFEPALPCPIHHLQCLVQQGQALFNLPCNLTCPGQERDKIGNPCLRSGGAERAQTVPQERYPFYNTRVFGLGPAAGDRSQCTPEGKALLGCYRNQLVCRFTQSWTLSDERKHCGAVMQDELELRATTDSQRMRDSAVTISSTMPSAK